MTPAPAAITGEPGATATVRLAGAWLWLLLFTCVAALAALTLALASNAERAQEQQQRAEWWRSHTLDVLLSAEQLDTALNKASQAERGYVLTGDAAAHAAFARGLTDQARLVRHLRRLTHDNRAQQIRLIALDHRVRAFAALSRRVVDAAAAGNEVRALALIRTRQEREAIANVGVVLDAIKADEHRLLIIREARNGEYRAQTRKYGHAILGFICALLVMVTGAVIAALRTRTAALRAADTHKKSERQYRLLADNASDVVLRTADDGSVVYISPSCIELSGYLPDELVGRACADFIHPDDFAVVHAAHVALITGAREAVTVEYRLRHKSDGWRSLESHMKPWRTPEGPGGGVISAIRDIERRKALELELVTARDAAESAAGAKSAFLANMSHEIRTPMNGVLGFTELVLGGELQPDQRRHIELIADSGRSMMQLLNDILDVSKIESGMMRVAEEPVDLRHIVRRCTDLMTPVAVAKGVALAAVFDAAVPGRIVGDALRLRQVLLNLIGNAAKFTERGSITVSVSVAGDRLRIDVLDTGIGIAADRTAVIFEQFTQADDVTAARFGGSGLGLSISGSLVRLMGGSISVRSVVGEGSAFSVLLPLRAADGAANALAVRGAPSPEAKFGRIPRVLIAEDVEINQVLMTAMAQRAGMSVAIAADGEAAVAMIEEGVRRGEPFDLVLMDMQMPKVNGIEATRRLRAAGFAPDTLPIVALTANAYADDVQACLDAGMQAHVAKPVRIRDLTAVLERFVDLRADHAAPSLGISPRIRAAYDARKAEMMKVLDALVAVDDEPTDDMAEHAADLLHKMAGTAAMFGEAALGDEARRLEEGLHRWPPAGRAARIRQAVLDLQAAA